MTTDSEYYGLQSKLALAHASMCGLGVIIVLILTFWYGDHQDKIRPHGVVAEIWHAYGVKSYDACHEWAFHDVSNPQGFDPFRAYIAWNRYHRVLFDIDPNDIINDSYQFIGLECRRRGL